MPDKGNPLVPVVLGRKKRYLKYTLGAVNKFRELTGLDIYRDGLKVLDLEAENFRALIYCGLLHEGAGGSLRQIGKKVNKKNIVEMIAAASIALELSLPDKSGDKEQKTEPAPMPDWLEISSFGRYCLKLTEKEFWQLTMAQYIALTECHQAEQERLDYRTAVIASGIYNTMLRTKGDKIFTPADIFPHYGWGLKEGKDSGHEATEEEIRQHFRIWAVGSGAEVSEN